MNPPVSVDPQRQLGPSIGRNLENFVQREKQEAINNKKDIIEHASDWRLRRLEMPYIPAGEFVLTTSDARVIIPDDLGHIEQDVGFYDGYIVAVIDGNNNLYEGIVDNTAQNSMRISFEKREGIEYKNIETLRNQTDQLSVAGILHPIQYERQRKAIAAFDVDSEKRGIIRGERPLTFTSTLSEESDPIDEELYENEEQVQGINRALAADQMVCLQGPPGTGKTRVIIELVRRLVRADKRILVAAETNAAADNILIGENDEEDRDQQSLHLYNSAVHSFGRFPVARNNITRSESQVVHKNYYDINPANAQVVVSTNNSAAKLCNQQFDYAIIDEAAQAMLTSTLIPYSISDRLILVGDHKQMPPERQSSPVSDSDNWHLSLFQRVYDEEIGIFGPDAGVRFTTQYRMHPEIAALPNEMFYDGQLETAVEPELPVSHPVVLFDIPGAKEQWLNNSPSNQAEAHLAILQAQYLLENGLSGTDIGIITPYTGQVEQIGRLIQELDDPQYEEIAVDTIAAFQGSEKPATILSFTRANEDDNVGFLNRDDGPNRLNVALSRAKQYMALVGDWETLRSHPLYDELYEKVTSKTPAQEYDTGDVIGKL